jgi:hypothetical protein
VFTVRQEIDITAKCNRRIDSILLLHFKGHRCICQYSIFLLALITGIVLFRHIYTGILPESQAGRRSQTLTYKIPAANTVPVNAAIVKRKATQFPDPAILLTMTCKMQRLPVDQAGRSAILSSTSSMNISAFRRSFSFGLSRISPKYVPGIGSSRYLPGQQN